MQKYPNPFIPQTDIQFNLQSNSDTKLSVIDIAGKEIMKRPDIVKIQGKHSSSFGLINFSISVGGKEKIDELTEVLIKDRFNIEGESRTTEDVYYESVVEDCEGNWVEITE